MRIIEPRLFIRDSCALGEGPFWFEKRLWWVDVDAGKLHTVDSAGEDRITHHMGRRIGAAAPAGDGKFIVALEDGIGMFHAASGRIDILASPEKHLPDNRFNDGKCDPMGRFVAGTLNKKGQRDAAALYSFGHGQGAQTILSPVSLSNGLAWSADGGTFYYIDTLTREIASFSYRLGASRLADRKIVATIPAEMGLPDGMDIDVDGNLWVAHWDGSAVRCWSPVNGQCLAEIRLPCPCPTSCCFGGANLDTLFITTAMTGKNPADGMAGSIFSCNPGVTGQPVRRFSD